MHPASMRGAFSRPWKPSHHYSQETDSNLSLGGRILKNQYAHTAECYSVVKRARVLTPGAMWMDLDNTEVK